MRRILMAATLAALVGGGLAGCGGSTPEEEYCSALEDARADLVALALTSGEEEGDYLEPTLRIFEELRQEATADLRDEWDTVVFAWRDLVEVVEETGVDPTTFDPATKPDDLSQEEFDRIRDVGAELGSERVRDAGRDISSHAQDVCDVSFDL